MPSTRARLAHLLHLEATAAALLLLATVAALLWANLAATGAYEDAWATELSLGLTEDLRHWVNDGLMAVFFYVVGLELRRELDVGELRDRKKVAVPVLAALGGMVVPAALFLALNPGGPASAGWGIPMATDIAFALGVLAVLGSKLPTTLRVFLLTLAIVDDIGAITVIAVFYSDDVDVAWLAVAAAGLAAVLGARRLPVPRLPVELALGLLVWVAFHESGVHPTLAGVLLGALTADREARLEHVLSPWTGCLVVPLFAVANAGVVLDADAIDAALGSSLFWGVAGGLLLGKLAGVSLASWVAVRGGLGRLPEGVGRGYVAGAAVVAGIGFTVALFIADLAFAGDAELADQARLGVLAGSAVAAVLGLLVLALAARVDRGTPVDGSGPTSPQALSGWRATLPVPSPPDAP